MTVSFIYWDDCVDPEDLEAMWMDPAVQAEWLNAGETRGSKVHLSRDPDGQPYLTQTEIKAVAGIIVRRHFVSQIDSDMICAIATLESDRQPLATQYNKKSKETTVGIMQILPKTAQWLVRDLGYQRYEISGNPEVLYKPFVNVYLGAAYLKWLSNYDQKERSEEFMVRAYKAGTKKAAHKSTLQFWKQYLAVKESLPSRKVFEVSPLPTASSAAPAVTKTKAGPLNTTWDSRTLKEDMEDMWIHPNVNKEWMKSGEKKGKVRFSHDTEKRPYLSRVELRAPGMVSMMRELQNPLLGSHHLGIDDTKNIARVVQHMLIDGALLQITARRLRGSLEKVEFLFENGGSILASLGSFQQMWFSKSKLLHPLYLSIFNFSPFFSPHFQSILSLD